MSTSVIPERADSRAGWLTLGVEEELLLVDPVGDGLAPVAGEVLRRLAGDTRFSGEFRSAQLELVSPVCVSPSDLVRELRALRVEAAAAAEGLARVVAAGAHPTRLDPGPISDSDRYRRIAQDWPWAARWMLTCGQHVHVGVSGAARTLAVYNALRSYLPLLAALGANSPFFGGADAGVSSVRSLLNRTLPRAGVPPAYETWRELEEDARWGARGHTLPDATFNWYDLRLNPSYGTIEVRVCDVQTRVEDAVALAALIQVLVLWLVLRHDAGEALPVHRTHRIAENLALANRDGTGGWLVDHDTGVRTATSELVDLLVDELAGVADGVGARSWLDRARLLVWEGGAERQRRLATTYGVDGLVDRLASDTLAGLDAGHWLSGGNGRAAGLDARGGPAAR